MPLKYFIVHAHHEPASFNGAMTRRAVADLTAAGHEVKVSDLYAMGFDPVSDRRNFTTVANPAFLKQQNEERHATEHNGFAPDLQAEMDKLAWCDVLVFQFPLWWFSMPAILKGWVDRVLAAGRIYGGGKWYSNGFGIGKRAMVSMTTGGPEAMYRQDCLEPPMDTLLVPIEHGVFWFNGFSVLPAFIAWSAAHGTDADRHVTLDRYAAHLLAHTTTPGRPPLNLADYPPPNFARKTT